MTTLPDSSSALARGPKKPTLPEMDQFDAFVAEIENGGSGHSKPCADLVRFLAYGVFEKPKPPTSLGRIAISTGKIIVGATLRPARRTARFGTCQ